MKPIVKISSWLLLSCMVILFLACQADDSKTTYPEFGNPQLITVTGYTGDAMEPFISRDGNYLFFNKLNDPSVNTNLHWATPTGPASFQFEGEITGVNTAYLEGGL